MGEAARILLVEDDAGFRSLLAAILEDDGYTLVEREDGKAALMTLQRQSFDLVLSDLRLPGLSGLELFRAAHEQGIAPPFVLLTAFGTVEEAVAAIKEGVVDFLTKPLKDPETLRVLVRRILADAMMARDLVVLKEREATGLPPVEVLFAGQAMQEVQRMLREVGTTNATVLITGESGTGKELAARAIHQASSRSKAPFVALNCAAIPENLLESELFGHEKGSFTGATQSRQGKFELASGGTLFLDEIGELPPLLQVKLLRVVQEKTFRRIGGSEDIKVDVRIISATNRNLAEKVKDGSFREDLYYRLNVIPIHLPALRHRKDDIPVLAKHFIEKYSKEFGKEIRNISVYALELLMEYQFPGNIRELENIIERSVALETSNIILPENLVISNESSGDAEIFQMFHIPDQGVILNDILADYEKQWILKALEKARGSKTRAAELLNITFDSMRYRIDKLGLEERS